MAVTETSWATERGASSARCNELFPSVQGRVYLKYIPVDQAKPR